VFDDVTLKLSDTNVSDEVILKLSDTFESDEVTLKLSDALESDEVILIGLDAIDDVRANASFFELFVITEIFSEEFCVFNLKNIIL
jgi:hypothetical protein